MKIEWDIEQEILVKIAGEFTPGESDEDVNFYSDGAVEDVKVYLGKFNITESLDEHTLDDITQEFLEYCEECIGDT